jgi:hypothetical protein
MAGISDFARRLRRRVSFSYSEIRLLTTSSHQILLTTGPLVLMIVFINGCAGLGTSRWAMDDAVYEEKYDDPYNGDDVDKAQRMMKQAIDARHAADRGGVYVGGAASDEPFALGAELGGFHYFGSFLETRGGIKGLAGTSEKDWFLGGDFGLRLQAPSRLTPFVGVGTFLGGNKKSVLAENDHLDNDDDLSVDERGEREDVYNFLASVYPELGVHFWINGKTRLTAGAQYHLTTSGRSNDFWFFGVSLAFLEM